MHNVTSLNDADREELERFRFAFAATGDIVYDWNLMTGEIFWSPMAREMLGLPRGTNMRWADEFLSCIHTDDLTVREWSVLGDRRPRGPYECEYRLHTDEPNAHCWVRDRGNIQRTEFGEPCRLVGVLEVITEQKEQASKRERAASHDPLTDLYTREWLHESLERKLTEALAHGTQAGYLLVGIDNLGLINDAFGYDATDEVVTQLGRRLSDCVRKSDCVGRVTGNRFGVVLGTCDEIDMGSLATKYLQEVRSSAVQTASGPVWATVSIGGIALPSGAHSVNGAIANATEVLSAAKKSGRDCYRLFNPRKTMEANRRKNSAIAARVVRALKERRLQLAYQPIIDAVKGDVGQYECLLYMVEPDGRVMAARNFISVVEQLGLVRQIDHYTLDLAIQMLRDRPHVRLALNVSSLTTTDQCWFDAITSILGDDRPVAERLTIEITETEIIQDDEASARFVVAMHELGCKVSLDDFGAGYTSFRNLQSLGVDQVKIDGSFICDLRDNPQNRLFVRTLLDLATGFGVATVAEGVEKAGDAEVLRKLGVGHMQGHYFGRPTLEPASVEDGAKRLTASWIA